LPSESLPAGQLWLNQGISGDTTEGILRRISAFKNTRPTHIYVMGGINDLRKGATDNEVLWNLRLVMRQLKQNHPRAQILIQSLLPTAGTIGISNERIRSINQKLASIAHQEGVDYVDLYSHFADTQGDMRPELTTDGLHLTPAGYRVWQSLMQEVEYWLALHQTGAYVS
jgi:lysophospholipase L1-like esterase